MFRRAKALMILVPPLLPARWLGPVAAMLRTAIRGMLTINILYDGATLLLDTDIPQGVPPVQQHWAEHLSLRFDEIFTNAYDVPPPYASLSELESFI